MNWQDIYRRYEAGVWAVPLALLPAFLLSALYGQPSCIEPIIEFVIAHTPLTFAHLVLNLLGPFARPLALVGSIALIMPVIGLLCMLTPPLAASTSRRGTELLRWLLVAAIILVASGYLASLAQTFISGFSALLAGLLFIPILLWTRTWHHPVPDLVGRRKVLHSLLGTPFVTVSLVSLATYSVWSNVAVRLFGLGNPVRVLFHFVAPGPRKQGFPVAGTDPEVTSVSHFYINGKNATDPLLLAQDWVLRITGLVRDPLAITYQQLLDMPRTDVYTTMRCVDNPVDGHLMSTAYWSGVRVMELLKLAQPLTSATTMLFHAADQFNEPFALAEPSRDYAMLVYAMNGETLSQAHGAPVRVLLPGWYGFRNVKWLQEVELTADSVDGYWEHNGWQAKKIHAVARIDVAQRLDERQLLVAGVAFGGLRGLSHVQVRTDANPWVEAELNIPALSQYSWVQWRAALPIEAQKLHITARMIDAAGIPQDVQAQGPYPDGSSGLHTIQVQL